MDKRDKVLIFGNGQVGNFYNDYFSSKKIPSRVTGTDVTDSEKVSQEVKGNQPNIVINAAGKTNLEWIDEHKLDSLNVNVLGALNVARASLENNAFLIHTSSGCIFRSHNENDWKKEDDPPEPLAFYSWTRIWAEDMVLWTNHRRYLILRLRQPVSAKITPKNMLIKMLTFSRFAHENAWNSGTVLEDLAWITEELIDQGATGTFHVANEGWLTPYEIALLLKKYVNPAMEINKISHQDLDKMMKIKRAQTIIDISKLKSLGINPPPYRQRLEEIIKELAQNIRQPENYKILQEVEKITSQRSVPSNTWKKIFKSSSDQSANNVKSHKKMPAAEKAD